MTNAGRRVAIAAAALAAVLPMAAAYAEGGQIAVNTGHDWVHDSSMPLFDFSRIAPGWTGSVTISVRNDSDSSAALTLTSTDIVDNENGCNHPERAVDATCSGRNAGELGHEMIFTVYPEAVDQSALFSGSLYDLEHGVTLKHDVAPGEVNSYRIGARLPVDTGNETQTDTVGFGLRLALAGADGSTSTQVEGVKVERGSGPLAAVLGTLPFTGGHADRMLTNGLWLLAVGTALTWRARRRQRRG